MKKLALVLLLALVLSPPLFSGEVITIDPATTPVVTPAGDIVAFGGLSATTLVVGTIVIVGLVAYAVSQNNNNQNIFTPTSTGTL